MMYRFKHILAAILCALLVLSMGTTIALDAQTDNIGDVEAAFLAFEKAVLARLVKDGYVTKADADLEINTLQQLFEESEEDIIYQMVLDGVLPYFESTMSHQQGGNGKDIDGMLIKLYSQLTGKSEADIKAALRADKITIWQLAAREGNLETMQKKLVEIKMMHLNELVKQGKMTEGERDSKIQRFEDKLKEFLKKQGA